MSSVISSRGVSLYSQYLITSNNTVEKTSLDDYLQSFYHTDGFWLSHVPALLNFQQQLFSSVLFRIQCLNFLFTCRYFMNKKLIARNCFSYRSNHQVSRIYNISLLKNLIKIYLYTYPNLNASIVTVPAYFSK